MARPHSDDALVAEPFARRETADAGVLILRGGRRSVVVWGSAAQRPITGLAAADEAGAHPLARTTGHDGHDGHDRR